MYSIKQNNIAVRFDDSGSLVSIIDHSDQFESNFLGNPDNVTNFPDKPVILSIGNNMMLFYFRCVFDV